MWAGDHEHRPGISGLRVRGLYMCGARTRYTLASPSSSQASFVEICDSSSVNDP
jgi:hypothetical protein